jgi:hypothetical protein
MNLGEKTSRVIDNLLRSKYVERDRHAAGEGIIASSTKAALGIVPNNP